MAVKFLIVCVNQPDEDYWLNLIWVLKYLKVKICLKLRLYVDDLSIIKWWVDVSFDVNKECKGQKWAIISIFKSSVKSLTIK